MGSGIFQLCKVKELFGGKKLGKAIAVFCAFFTMIAGIPSIATQTLSAASLPYSE